MDGHALAEFEAAGETGDYVKIAAKKFVDRHGDKGTLDDALAILAEQ